MRRLAGVLLVLSYLPILGGSAIAEPPNRVSPPPSGLVRLADHLSIQAGRHVAVPLHVGGWQSFTLFRDADFSSSAPLLTRCIAVGGLNGLGDNLATIDFPQGGNWLFDAGSPQKSIAPGPLFGPDFVMTIDAPTDLPGPVVINAWLYLH